MSQAKCLLTGATSFTGAYIAQQLIKQDFEVYTPLRSPKDAYKGLKAERLNLIPQAKFITPCDISSGELVDLVNKIQPQIFINHGGFIDNYRSEDFNFLKHLEVSLKYVKTLIKSLKDNDCKLFIHSGSAFEATGLQQEKTQVTPNKTGPYYSQFGVSPYGVAKKMVWDMLAFWCNKEGLRAVKIIIPNPYGHLENKDRLLPVFASMIKADKTVKLSGSQDIRNNIRGEILAECYAQVCLSYNNDWNELISEVQPIGHIESQLEFVKRALQEPPYNLSLKEIEQKLLTT